MNFYVLQLKEIVDVLHDDTLLLDSILMHMGSGYTTLGKFDQAISLYTRGLKIIERKFGMCLIFGYHVSFVKLSITSISIIYIYRFTNIHIIGNLILGTLFLTMLSKSLILDLMVRYCQ